MVSCSDRNSRTQTTERYDRQSGTVLVDFEIWTEKHYDGTGPYVAFQKDRLVYNGTGTMHRWDDEIRVPFDQMTVPSGEEYGLTYATVHTQTGWLTKAGLLQPD